jgi:hypothetical protein
LQPFSNAASAKDLNRWPGKGCWSARCKGRVQELQEFRSCRMAE